MKTLHLNARSPGQCLALILLLVLSRLGVADALPALVDNFSHSETNHLGIQRQFMNDSLAGGSTTTTQQVTGGILSFSGTLVPPRGQPAWASAIFPLEQPGQPRDASAFNGVRLRIKANDGNISISANSTEITNFDFHTAPVVVREDGQFHEVKIPFAAMKRAWSEQTPLNTATLNSLSIVAYSVQKETFSFEVAEVSFY